MKYKLLKFKADWADEMDMTGYRIMTEHNYNKWLENVNKCGCIFVGFGTNEDNEYNSPEDYLKCFNVIDISEVEVNVLENLLGLEFGQTGMSSQECEDWDEG